ncbi:GAF domain-containing protein [Streptomyces sp. NPDC051784]|uniref:GAF domain-containing protein n=1 Tax=Streptomyces sp. NPDC051784 TaxID=3155805 RepID=UPI00341C7B55
MGAANGDKIKRIGLFVLSALLAGGVFVLSIVADEEKGAAKWRWTGLGALVAVSVVAVAAYENRRAETARQKTHEQAVKAAGDLALAYNLVLVPVTEQLRDLTAAYVSANPRPAGIGPTPAESTLSRDVLRTVLEGAVALTAEPTPTSLPRARSAYYAREAATGDFVRTGHHGRTPPPKPRVSAGDMGGAHMEFLLNTDQSFHADGTPGNISIINPLGNDYRAVIAVPVRVGTDLFGVLVVDAPDYEDFIPAHVDLMRTLAGTLASALLTGGV